MRSGKSALDRVSKRWVFPKTEVRWRQLIRQVLYCDFLSMYPTLCTFMSLWRFVIAHHRLQFAIRSFEARDEAWLRSRRKVIRGGFTFKLSEKRWRPAIQIRHLNARFAHPVYASE
jgi:hypothetical protein